MSDFGSTYTNCDDKGKKRVAWFKKNDCKEVNVTLPASNKELSCSLECKNGEYIAPPLTECKECKAGTYSFTSGISITDWRKDSPQLPKDLKNFCNGLKCSKWEFHEHYIDSGNQNDMDGIISTLEFSSNIIREDGKILFKYKVDAERIFDGLSFYINNKLMLRKVSQTYGYVEKEFKLAKGVNKFTWVYSKDGENTRGRDRAFIKLIKVYGTKLTSDKCIKCPKGTFSKNKAESCIECDPNTYSDKEASTECKKCPEGTYALHHGSTTCIPRPKCTSKNYFHHFTDCSAQSKRNKIYEWNQPKICSGGVTKPNNQNDVECASCPKGSFRTSSSKGVCITCTGTGSYFNEAAKQCQTCKKGTLPLKFKRYETWSSKALPKGWTTKCIGLCPKNTHKGFQVTTHGDVNHLVSGYGEITELEFNIELETRGRIIIEYKIHNDDSTNKHSAVLLLLVNNLVKGQLYKNDDGDDKIVEFSSSYLKPGQYPVKLTFEKYQSRDKKAKVLIKSITVEGEKTGGASECSPCPAGFDCLEKPYTSVKCKPGSYSKLGEDKCSLCPINTFTHDSGKGECEKCGTGTTSKVGSTLCDNSCKFEFTPTAGSTNNQKIAYDLTSLAREFYGPVRVFNTSHNIYLNICGKVRGNACKGRSGDYLKTYSCLGNKYGYTVDIGSIINFKPISDDKKKEGFIIELNEGSICKKGKPRMKSEILFKCNPDAGKGSPVLNMGIPTHYLCDWNPVKFIWESAVACPVCTKDQIRSATSDCQNGKKTTSYFYERPKHCFEADPNLLPKSFDTECKSCNPSDYYYVDTKCINRKFKRHYVWKKGDKCEGGVPLPANAEFSCSDLTLGWKTATIIASSVLVLILTLSVAFLVVCRSHQKLKYEYDILQQRSDSDELDDLDSLFSDEDDDTNNKPQTGGEKNEKSTKKD